MTMADVDNLGTSTNKQFGVAGQHCIADWFTIGRKGHAAVAVVCSSCQGSVRALLYHLLYNRC